MDENDFGKLIWPKFYGPRIGDKKREMVAMIGLAMIFLSFVILTLILMSIRYWKSFTIMFVGISVISILIIGAVWIRKKALKDPNIILVKKGDLEWDIHENGIVTKYPDKNQPDGISTKFIRFDEISRVYFQTGKENAHILLNMIKEMEKNKADWKELNNATNTPWTKFIADYIWLIDGNGKLIDCDIEKAWVENLERFESILRQKVKDVD